jgi:HPt (histidine-containing phosphotransfer) domain-containing protein
MNATTKDFPSDPNADAGDEEWSAFYDKAVTAGQEEMHEAVRTVMRNALATEQKPVTYSQQIHDAHLMALAAGLTSIKALVGVAGAKRRQLEARVAALEARSEKTISDWGVWKAETEYPAGAAVSHQGGLWIAKLQTTGRRPGDGALWRLAVKKGSAG